MAEPKIVVCPQCGKKYKVAAEATAASFACKQCGATVWLEGKPKTPSGGRRKTSSKRAGSRGKAPSGKRSGGRSGGRTASRGAAAKGGARPAARGRGRGRGREEESVEEEGGRGRGRYEKKPDNSTNIILAVGGLVVLVAAIAFFAMRGGDEEAGPGEETATNTNTEKSGGMGDKPVMKSDPATTDDGSGAETPEADPETDVPEKDDPEVVEEPKKLQKEKTRYKIDKKTGKKVRLSRWNPPDDIGHLESTPPEKRKEIDDLITVMFDPSSGSDGFKAKRKLVQMDKAAFLPLLAKIKNTKKLIKWDRSIDDNQLMSSVRMADEVLREMDGYMEAKQIGKIRPGTDEKYYDYLLRIYYKRWLTDLSKLDRMPGPYDPSVEYENEDEKE